MLAVAIRLKAHRLFDKMVMGVYNINGKNVTEAGIEADLVERQKKRVTRISSEHECDSAIAELLE